ncbi:MAG: SMR family transporter [Thiohalomonadaceae bacterium]
MTRQIDPLLLVLFSVLLSSAAQVSFKVGMASIPVQQALNGGSLLERGWAIASSLPVLVGMMLYLVSVALWLLALARLDLSLAYPFVGLGIIITVVVAVVLLGEPVGVGRILGVLFVVGGIWLVARG